MFKKIMIPIDMAHPERAPEMIEAARKLGEGKAKMVLATIIHSVPAMAELSVPPEYFENAKSEARKALSGIAKAHGVDADIELRVGQPANDILQIQKDLEVDLIIVGSHRPGFQDYFLGSTAARVVRHAQCPVLVMR